MPLRSDIFPPHSQADKEGLLCWGGNLEPDTLLHAYSYGIFPWYNSSSPILWWSPPERMILTPETFKTSKTLKQTINRNVFNVTFDTAFAEVIKNCAQVPRHGEKGTWITRDMTRAYINLHKLGFAHSVEARLNGKLVGGLYGISLGKVFFGESMFFKESNASKVAFYYLIQALRKQQFELIDCQQNTPHLASLGAFMVPRKNFLSLLHKALNHPTLKGPWLFDNLTS